MSDMRNRTLTLAALLNYTIKDARINSVRAIDLDDAAGDPMLRIEIIKPNGLRMLIDAHEIEVTLEERT